MILSFIYWYFFTMRHSEIEMTELIFVATERLMAKDGFRNLSMHKIAKEANIATGTIYLYFKNKDELLEKLARRLFFLFSQCLEQGKNEGKPYFEQYRQMWWNLWRFLQDNPLLIININQYKSLPILGEIILELEEQSYWNRFCQRAIEANELCNFQSKLLFSLSLDSAIKLSIDRYFLKQELSEIVLEDVIIRTWRTIQK